jgi:hypothetical protein
VNDVERFAVGVHGSLVTLHLLGCVYNARRKNRLACCLHALAALYSSVAVLRHRAKC